MKIITNKIWDYYLVPVLSTFLFVTIVTISPITLTEKMNSDELQMIAVTQSEAPQAAAIPDKTNTPASSTAVSAPAPAPAPAKPSTSTPAKNEQPQPTRSTSPSTTNSSKKTSSANTAQAAPAKSTTSQTKANSIITTAKQYIGVKYVYGGTTPSGFDCSGFVQYVFAKNGISLPRISRDQFKTGTSVSSNNLQPADLVFFSLAKNGVVDHVGIYVGNGQFINASSSKGVTIYSLGTYWNSAFLGAKRVL